MSRTDKENVIIPKDVYEELVRNRGLLSCLESCGVDNWSGYSEAVAMYEEEEEDYDMNLEKIQWLVETLKVIGGENELAYRELVTKALLKELGCCNEDFIILDKEEN